MELWKHTLDVMEKRKANSTEPFQIGAVPRKFQIRTFATSLGALLRVIVLIFAVLACLGSCSREPFILVLSAMGGKARVYLGRIPYAARHRDIEDFFRGYGKVTDIALKHGFAFVEFETYRDAEDAVDDLHGKTILGDR